MKLFALVLCFFLPAVGFTQFVASFHQSNLPFAGVGYQFKNKIRPEFRIGTDNYFDVLALEAVVMYNLIQKDEYEFYAGIGGRVTTLSGVVVPVGLNVYPLPAKQFGFHIELAPIVAEAGVLLRGSWGIRYRFRKKG